MQGHDFASQIIGIRNYIKTLAQPWLILNAQGSGITEILKPVITIVSSLNLVNWVVGSLF